MRMDLLELKCFIGNILLPTRSNSLRTCGGLVALKLVRALIYILELHWISHSLFWTKCLVLFPLPAAILIDLIFI